MLGGSPRTWQVWGERAAGPASIVAAQRTRLESLIERARRDSPLYRETYARVARGTTDLRRFPVVSKRLLMARFDDWATDRAINRREVERFLTNGGHIGEAFLGRYVVWRSSGTSGEPGIYVQDESALEAYDALIAVQLGRPDLFARCATGMMFRGGRSALIAATGDHYAGIASWQRSGRSDAGRRSFSVLQPVDELVEALNAFGPAFVASYPTVLVSLAEQRRAGRLRITPDLIWAGGESLSHPTQQGLEDAFDCPVVNEYGASECMSIAYGCPSGWLHVNEDWVIAEPVDRNGAPTRPGHVSHTLLITNLANQLQPLIRYDLGDAVELHPGRCDCGNAMQALRVAGRQDDIVTMRSAAGPVNLSPMELSTALEEASQQHCFQIAYHAPDRLEIRLPRELSVATRNAAFARGASALRSLLRREGIEHVRIDLGGSAPTSDTVSGKLRQVITAAPATRGARRAASHRPLGR